MNNFLGTEVIPAEDRHLIHPPILNLALGGSRADPSNSSTRFPATVAPLHVVETFDLAHCDLVGEVAPRLGGVVGVGHTLTFGVAVATRGLLHLGFEREPSTELSTTAPWR